MSLKILSSSRRQVEIGFLIRVGAAVAICCLAMPCDGKAPAPPQPDRASESSTQSKSSGASSKRTARFDAFNFELDMPSQPWVETKHQVTDTSLRLSFVRSRPETYVSLIAQQMGIYTSFDLDYAVKDSKAHLKSENPDVQFLGDTKDSAGGMDGMTYKASVSTRTQKRYFVHWVGLHNGYAYQLRTQGPLGAADEVAKANREFVNRLHMIEPSRVAQRLDGAPIAKFTSPTFGYQVDLSGLNWIEWKDMKAQASPGEFGARHKTGAALIVVPVALPGRTPNIESLCKVAAKGFKVDYPSPDIVSVKPIQIGALHGQQIEAKKTVNSHTSCYFMRVVADDRAAYFMVAWAAGIPDCEHFLKEGLDRVTITTRELKCNTAMDDNRRDFTIGVLNELGHDAIAQGDFVAAADYYRGALEFGAARDAVLTNYLRVLAELNRTEDGLAAFDLYSRRFKEQSPQLQAVHARLLAQAGRIYDAVMIYSSVFENGYSDEAELMRFVDLTLRAKLIKEAIKATDAVVEHRPTLQLLRLQAALYAIEGDNAKSIALLTKLREQNPSHAGIAFDLATVYERAKNYDSALAITKLLVDAGVHDEQTLLLHGRVQLALQKFADAKQTFEHAQLLYPRSQQASELLKLASSQLGEGENSVLKEPIAAVQIPDSVREAIDKAGTPRAAAADEVGVEELSRITGIVYKAKEPMRTTLIRRVKVLSPDGVARMKTLTFKIDENREQFFVNRLVVLDEHGEKVAEGSVENYYVSDDTAAGMATNTKVVTLPVPGLKPGYTLECVVTRRDYRPQKDFAFRETEMASSLPVDVSAFFIQGDVKQLKWASSTPLDIQVHGDVLQCVAVTPAFYRSEVRQPALNTFVPVMWVNASSMSWDGEANDFLKLIQDRLTVDEKTRELADELTRDCNTRQEKIAAIAGHVQQTYTYQAIEFGRRGLVPNPPARTIKLKYGDCKDHALLMKQLLDSAGIPAHLALVKSSGAIAEDLPSIKQFDHMVVFVPDEADRPSAGDLGGIVLDGTEKDANPLLSPPYGLESKSIFVLDPQHLRFIHTPGYPQGGAQVTSNRHVKLQADPADDTVLEAHVSEEATFQSYLAPAMRAFIKHFEPGERREAIQTLMSQHNKVRVDRFNVVNLDRPAEPLRVELEYVMVDSLHCLDPSTKKSFLGYLPSAWERQFIETEYLQVRDTPFEITAPITVVSTTRIEPPTGLQLTGLERFASAGETKFVKWSSHASQESGVFSLECRYELASGRHKPQEYQQFYSEMKKSLMSLSTPIMLDQATLETARATGEQRAR
jgi:tetratricopeptide (TPR) repeat protein